MKNYIAISLLLFFALSGCITTQNYVPEYRVRDTKAAQFDITSSRPFVPSEWIVREVTIEEIESEYLKGGHKNTRRNEIFEKFKSIIETKDKLYFFDTPEEYWCTLSGVQGYTVIRNGISITGIVTKMN